MFSVTVMIETPRHAIGKYFFDEKKKVFRLKKMLPLGMHFPYDFGMIRHTTAEDGDPLDAMVMTECNTYPDVEMECRPIGALLANQKIPGKKKFRNDRFLFVSLDSRLYQHLEDIHQLSRKHNQELIDFFINYNKLENKLFEPLKLVGSTKAESMLRKQINEDK